MMAATLTGVPVRIYQLHGLRFETAVGWRRQLLKTAERVTCHLADRILCVSPSLRRRGLEEGLFASHRATVLAHGSVNGLDVHQFRGHDDLMQLRQQTRRQLSDTCVGVLSRFRRTVGARQRNHGTACRMAPARTEFRDLHLLLVGPFEAQDPIPQSIQTDFRNDPRVHLTGLDWRTRGYYSAMDIFALPSHREGLGHVLLEAAAMELPVVSCRVTGCVDALVNGHSGTLVPPRDAQALAAAVSSYIGDARKRRHHGRAGRQWVERQFAPERIWQALRQEYETLLESRTDTPARKRQGPRTVMNAAKSAFSGGNDRNSAMRDAA